MIFVMPQYDFSFSDSTRILLAISISKSMLSSFFCGASHQDDTEHWSWSLVITDQDTKCNKISKHRLKYVYATQILYLPKIRR